MKSLKYIKDFGMFPLLSLTLTIKTIHQLSMDELLYGTSFKLEVTRKWYNPIRYFLGKEKIKRLDPMKVIISKNEWKGTYKGVLPECLRKQK